MRSRDPLSSQMSLFGSAIEEEPEEPREESLTPDDIPDPDSLARQFAADPRNNVVLEASAGTGKTSVLVSRYINLLKGGVDPANILAITFTRKAAAEMRDRIIRELRLAAGRSEFDAARWRELRDRLGDIAISTIDAFCLSLLKEFPLEADLDPGFQMADETEVPRLVEEALDRSMRIFTGLARTDPDVALVLAQLGASRTREGLATLIDRRLVAGGALDRFLLKGPADLTSESVLARAATAVQDTLCGVRGGLESFLADGPSGHPRYQLFLRELRALPASGDGGAVRTALDRVAAHFVTSEGNARTGGSIHPYRAEHYPTPDAAKRHRAAVFEIAPLVERVMAGFARDLNVVLARGVRRMFGIAVSQYRRALDERSVLDFADVLHRALELLRHMDEFAQSRFRLESRFHHVLVDELQDTSRAQWELVSLMIQAWGEGAGLAAQPSIFVVGDRKQSIYRFRDADVTVLQQAARCIQALRPASAPRRSIARSFRAVPRLLEFVNEAFDEMSRGGGQPDAFSYTDADRFPVDASMEDLEGPVLGIAAAEDPRLCATAVAAEIERLLRNETVRDRETGLARSARAGDVAILFRSRASHREFERELTARGIPAYVYKGLGFFDADETKDVVALLRYLARPVSDLRAAAFLRSRFVRLSDRALALLAPRLAAALLDGQPPVAEALDAEDRRALDQARRHVFEWLERTDRVPPADLVEQILSETVYACELQGPRRSQAVENLKKIRGLIRRIQNRGYATVPRVADHVDSLAAGDESNAALEAVDAVNLMTVHASKGLEFPIVFVVNLAKGATGVPKPIRVVATGDDEPTIAVGPFVTDEDEAERDRQETRRLSYVAFTRARDRLYLSSAVKDGALVPGRGSMAEVLPRSLQKLFEEAAASPSEILTWTSRSGKSFRWRVCRQPENASATEARAVAPIAESIDLLGPPPGITAERHASVGEWVRHSPSLTLRAEKHRNLTTGILVHRLFQALAGRDSNSVLGDAQLFARRLLTEEERAVLEDEDAVVEDAVATWRVIGSRPDVVELFESGRAFHEVPFSLAQPSSPTTLVLRGVIDCIVQRRDGTMVVVEFKTGSPREAHTEQLEIYVRAAQLLFPDRQVQGRLIYP